MKHSGHCSRACGHVLSSMQVKHTQEIQHMLNSDPRVVEYSAMQGDLLHVVYALHRTVSEIHRVRARSLNVEFA